MVVLVMFISTVPLSGCSSTTRVGDILANPSKYEGKQVGVKGYVGDTLWFAILKKGAYQIGDGSGTIWVVTTQPPPQKGVEISAQGSVSSALKLENMTFGTVITESQRG